MKYRMKEVVERTGISSYTIRYYEKEGIIPPIQRDNSGIRLFTGENLFWIDMVCCLKKTKMSVNDIKRIVQLSQEGDSTIPERKEILIKHRTEIDRQIDEMRESKKKIDVKIAYYDGEGSCE